MNYFLRRLVWGTNGQEIPLSATEFSAIEQARQRMDHTLHLEELFNILMENYEEFEQELLTHALNGMFFPAVSWGLFQADKHTLNRRLANLLTASRMYLDQVPHLVAGLFGRRSAQARAFADARTREESEQASFRICSVLRDFMQHEGLVIGGLVKCAEVVDGGHHFSTKASLNESIRNSNGRKPRTDELRALPEGTDLRPIVRAYVDCLNRIHRIVRDGIQPHYPEWAGIISASERRYIEDFGEETTGLAAIKVERGQIRLRLHINGNTEERIRVLIGRNPLALKFATAVVSNKLE